MEEIQIAITCSEKEIAFFKKLNETIKDEYGIIEHIIWQWESKKKMLDDTKKANLIKVITRILKENSFELKEYKSGRTKYLGFFVGKIMKETFSSFDPKLVNEVLLELLPPVNQEEPYDLTTEMRKEREERLVG